jgi:hypothetical protein
VVTIGHPAANTNPCSSTTSNKAEDSVFSMVRTGPMKIVAWNGRGFGNRSARRGLQDIKKREDPDVLFLSETKLDEKRMEKFQWLLGMPNIIPT